MSDITTQDWFHGIVDEISGIWTQKIKIAREEKIRAFWDAGKALLKVEGEHETKRGESLRKTLAKHIGCSYSYLCQSAQVATAYTEFEDVYKTRHGENVSIGKLIKLINGDKEVVKEVCPKCGSKVDPKRLQN
jgi:hypothetical protein